jgi:hypothetical protein
LDFVVSQLISWQWHFDMGRSGQIEMGRTIASEYSRLKGASESTMLRGQLKRVQNPFKTC